MDNVYELTAEREGKSLPGRIIAIGAADAREKRDCILASIPDALVIEYSERYGERRWAR
jgi:hypothetical protein